MKLCWVHGSLDHVESSRINIGFWKNILDSEIKWGS